MAQQKKLKGGIKLRRSAKHKTMYAAQSIRTARNKLRQANKRTADRAFWRDLANKQNGAVQVPIKTIEPHENV